MLVLDDATPERDPPENPRDGRGLVASMQIRPEPRRLAHGVDPAGAFDVGRDVLDAIAHGDEIGSPRPVGFVDDRCKPQSTRRLLDAPDAPSLGVLDNSQRFPEVHLSSPPRPTPAAHAVTAQCPQARRRPLRRES